MPETHRSFCRQCINQCAILVDVESGRVVQVRGDGEDPLYKGFTCIKGRSQPDYLYSPDRVLHPLKMTSDGFKRISMAQAVDEIGERLLKIVEEHGPNAVGCWSGTMAYTGILPTAVPTLMALMDGIGTTRRYDPNTIDKGGKQIAAALHGKWMAPSYGFDDPAAVLLIGINPMLTFTGFPGGNPGQWLKDRMRQGMELIVIDPRRSDVAARASIYLQPKPGHDVAILAAIVHVILREQLWDRAFVAENAEGLDQLRDAVAAFTPEYAAAMADVDAADLEHAARVYAAAPRAYAMAGTGPHMGGQGSLFEYLILCLETLCGNWLRAGDRVRTAPTLLPSKTYRAQAEPPMAEWRLSEPLQRGLSATPAGMPASTLADQMLAEGGDRLRGLISLAGNPVSCLPDQQKTVRALRGADLFVQIDPWMSQSASIADYVIPPTLPLETASSSTMFDFLSGRATGYGLSDSYAHYAHALVSPPANADVIDEWRFLRDVGVRMGLDMTVRGLNGMDVALTHNLTTEAFLEQVSEGSRIPLKDVLELGRGAFYPDQDAIVEPKAEGWAGRFNLAAPAMLADLQWSLAPDAAQFPESDAFPLRLVCRRHRHAYGSSCHVEATHKGALYNPAYVHPEDLAAYGVAPGEIIELRSPKGRLPVVAQADDTLRRGLVSIAYGYGAVPGSEASVLEVGSNINLLISNDEIFDPYTGQPRMSNVPVEIHKFDGANSQRGGQ